MSPDLLALAATLAVFQGSGDYSSTPSLDLVELAENRWWGPKGQEGKHDTKIYEYKVKYTDDMVKDLKARLNATRGHYTLLEGAQPFDYGFNQLSLKNWTDYWMNKYDFKKQEALWNKYPAYKTNIQGMDIVYFRITPKVDSKTELVPLLIQHGWPGSPHEFWQAAEHLTAVSADRDFAVDLILPCLPGFGFSQAAAQPGLGAAQTAVVMRNLMHRIGYKKFYIQGGDLGALTMNNLVTRFPDEVLGYHTNMGLLISSTPVFLQMIGALYPPLIVPNKTYSLMYPLEQKFFTKAAFVGYLHLQAARPDTIGVPLIDSPIGMLGYCLEKYATSVTDFNGNLYNVYTPEYLIDTMMFYWSTHSMQTAVRYYSETFNKKHYALGMDEIPVHVPVALMQASGEFSYQSPLILSLKFKNIISVNDDIKGGHFIAYQQPELFSEDVLGAIKKFRALAAKSAKRA